MRQHRMLPWLLVLALGLVAVLVVQGVAPASEPCAHRKPHPISLDTILTKPKMVTKEERDGRQAKEEDADRQ